VARAVAAGVALFSGLLLYLRSGSPRRVSGRVAALRWVALRGFLSGDSLVDPVAAASRLPVRAWHTHPRAGLPLAQQIMLQSLGHPIPQVEEVTTSAAALAAGVALPTATPIPPTAEGQRRCRGPDGHGLLGGDCMRLANC